MHYLSATEALRLFRSGELSPVELTEAVIARAEAVEIETDAAVLAKQQRIADTFYALKLIPKPIKVSDAAWQQAQP